MVKSLSKKSPQEKTSENFDSEMKIYRLEDQVGYFLRRAHQRASNIFQTCMGESKLTPLQFAAIVKIRDEGMVSQNHLGRLTNMDPATVMGVVKRILARELIRRVPDLTDRRRAQLLLTAKGLALLEAFEINALKVSHDTLAPLNEQEQQKFLALLRRLT